MCGIVLIAADGWGQDGATTELLSLEGFQDGLACRGPDACGTRQVRLEHGATLLFASSLLQLRGRQAAAVPHVDSSGNILLFNGEVFGGLPVPEGANDGAVLMAALGEHDGSCIVRVLSRLRGPWALVYWHALSQTLWFGRDAIGRRSLLMRLPSAGCPSFCLASTASSGAGSRATERRSQQETCSLPGANTPLPHVLPVTPDIKPAAAGTWQELEPGMYSMRFGKGRYQNSAPDITRHEWGSPTVPRLAAYQREPSLIPPPSSPDQAAQQAACAAVLQALQEAVATRCRTEAPEPVQATALPQGGLESGLLPAPVLVLFSGGIDSTLLAALAHRALPEQAPIDLATICFDGGVSPDRQSALDAFEELRAFAPGREWRLIEVDASLADVDAHMAHILDLLHPASTIMDLNIGSALWLAARAEGRLRLHTPSPAAGNASRCGAPVQPDVAEEEAPDAGGPCQVLRSRGATCPAEQEGAPSVGSHAPPADTGGGQMRKAGGSSCALAEREQTPAGTPAGVSKGGGGGLYWRGGARQYRSAARVVLVGHGADELCGGYGRHRTRFREQGWGGLAGELALDAARLWARNLGRDDRLLADTGREARHPFLDEGFIKTLLAMPLALIADLRLPPGAGDKHVLRGALASLGLHRAAARVKRAIQFGTRLSNQCNVRDFGSNRAANLRKAGSLRLAERRGQNG